jgi:hypothetical protein
MKKWAIDCDSQCGPVFGNFGQETFRDIRVGNNCNKNTGSGANLGVAYINDTELLGNIVFTGWQKFQVTEIEVFEIAV